MSSTVVKPGFRYLLACVITLNLFCTPVSEARYRCMLKDFIRLGNSCYFLSTEIATWQEAHFRCRDRGSQLAVLASQYEDSTLRSYLERPEFAQLGRWLGGMWAGKWIWAAQGSDIENEKSFVNEEAFNLGETDQWMCLFMNPNNRYLWSNENCMRQFHYICEAPLARESESAIDDASPAGISSETMTSTTTSTTTTEMPMESHAEEDIYQGNTDAHSNTDSDSEIGEHEMETSPLVTVSLPSESPFEENEHEDNDEN